VHLAGEDDETAAFIAAVRAVAAVAPPADPHNLSGMSLDFDHYLWRCPAILEVAVRSSPDPARQLTARCRADPAASPQRVATEIEQAWLRDLRYRHWEAHLLRVTPTSVQLDVATQVDEGGYYVTGLITARWSGGEGCRAGRDGHRRTDLRDLSEGDEAVAAGRERGDDRA